MPLRLLVCSMFRPDPNINAKLRAAVQEGVNAYLLIVARTMRAELSKPGGGRLYRIGKGRRKARNAREAGIHRASRSGQPPAPDTGMLRRSWQIGSGQLRGNTGGIGATFSNLLSSARRKLAGPDVRQAVVTPLNDSHRIGYRYGSAVPYARIDRGWGRVAPRPYIAPTLDSVRDLFEPTVALAMQRHFGGPPR